MYFAFIADVWEIFQNFPMSLISQVESIWISGIVTRGSIYSNNWKNRFKKAQLNKINVTKLCKLSYTWENATDVDRGLFSNPYNQTLKGFWKTIFICLLILTAIMDISSSWNVFCDHIHFKYYKDLLFV